MNKKILVIVIIVVVVALAAAFFVIGNSHKTLPGPQSAEQVSGVNDSAVNSVGQDIPANDSDFSDNSLNDLG